MTTGLDRLNNKEAAMMRAGRLTSGNQPLHIRRRDLTNQLRTTVHAVRTSIANWPAEYDLAADHPIFELLEVIEIVCDKTEAAP